MLEKDRLFLDDKIVKGKEKVIKRLDDVLCTAEEELASKPELIGQLFNYAHDLTRHAQDASKQGTQYKQKPRRLSQR